jgi:hypothetical protein
MGLGAEAGFSRCCSTWGTGSRRNLSGPRGATEAQPQNPKGRMWKNGGCGSDVGLQGSSERWTTPGWGHAELAISLSGGRGYGGQLGGGWGGARGVL